MQLVDEQDDLAVGFSDFLDDGLKPILEFAPILRPGDERAHVQGDDLLVLEHGRHIAVDDADGQALDDGGLADAGFADQYRIVLGAPAQDLHGAADFLIAADHRIQLALAGEFDQIAAISLQRLILGFRILVGDALAASDVLEGGQDGIMIRRNQ